MQAIVMKAISLGAALALTMTAAATTAVLADDWSNYGAHGRYGPDYGYQKAHDFRHEPRLLPRAELTRRIERQGYAEVRDLRPGKFGGDWQATALLKGVEVRLAVDPYSGRVIPENGKPKTGIK
jgi:hypothetical protein